MSVFLMIGAAAVAEGVSETTKSCVNKAKDYAKHKLFGRKQREMRKRRERREFI
jgi:hypothetical protein